MPKVSKPVLLVAGGGTGGHIQPAIAIADAYAAANPDVEIRFCGTAKGMESTLVPAAGYPYHAVRASGFPRRLSAALWRAAADFVAGRRECARLIRTYRPFAVVGTGGYVCGPLVSAAKKAGVPVLLHEQNAYPGKANRYLSRGAHTVCISYEGTERYFGKAGDTLLTGNPVREVFFRTRSEDARKSLGLADGDRMVLVLGGSQGAASITEAILAWSRAGLPDRVRIVLMVGRKNFEGILREAAGLHGIDVRDYIQDVHVYMAAADLLVCRAGALTCAEIAALGKPSVLVPYPYAAGDHQTFNALAFEREGASLHVPDGAFTPSAAGGILESLLADPDRLRSMGLAAATLAKPDAAASIAERLARIRRETGHGGT
ncbi:MAG: undecaprenyldiphospho-muramoylpentapeptide beta-N-acetylglucosaminyltransferase [Clostridia bacterium]|nr:undecaprenyldiphospho-muramoylpentapeptide beta-N-acetylglucosaminyltransferase [Clostridia bacterium]